VKTGSVYRRLYLLLKVLLDLANKADLLYCNNTVNWNRSKAVSDSCRLVLSLISVSGLCILRTIPFFDIFHFFVRKSSISQYPVRFARYILFHSSIKPDVRVYDISSTVGSYNCIRSLGVRISDCIV
jgi:hypothetical protein